MSIRKRTWKTVQGEQREGWICDYVDQHGDRHIATFPTKRAATEFEATTRVQISEGTHVSHRKSVTVKEAGETWLATCRAAGLERSTLEQYDQQLRLHIVPFIGAEKLSKINVPLVRAFQDRLHKEGRSPSMVRGVLGSLGALLSDAQERGLVVLNAVHALRGRRRKGARQDRHIGKLKVGVNIPTPEEVRAILAAAKGRWRPFLMTAALTGLRASELRGLRWSDVDFEKGELHVRQRADRYNKIGSPKSASGERTIPLTPGLLQALREWRLVCPKKDGRLGLVFPNGQGNIEGHPNIVLRGLIPTVLAAGVTVPVLDEQGNPKRDDEGRPTIEAKYSGLHSFRHFFCSWCINRKAEGGLELPVKVVQERMGHASVSLTLNRYGHLFPRGDDSAELAAAERALLG